jgi:hypothetical protein
MPVRFNEVQQLKKVIGYAHHEYLTSNDREYQLFLPTHNTTSFTKSIRCRIHRARNWQNKWRYKKDLTP